MKKGDDDAEEWKALIDDEEDECSDSESEEVLQNEVDATKAKATGHLDKLNIVLDKTKASKQPVTAKAGAAKAQSEEPDPQDEAAAAKEAKKRERQVLEAQPINKGRKWLKDIVATITAVREAHKESNDKVAKRLVPPALQSEFSQLFTTRVNEITKMRDDVEQSLAASRGNKEFLKKGGEEKIAKALALKDDCDRDSRVWKRTYDVYLNTASDSGAKKGGEKKPRRSPTPP